MWLIGMMGAGKSTVGPELAALLGLRFVDTDAEIERESGLSVTGIFERDGEASFRAKERAVIDSWIGRNAVVALGGGAPAQPGMAPRLAAGGVLVYLRARPASLLERLGDCSERPMLASLDPEERRQRLTALLEERREAYECADLTLDTDGQASGELAAEIAARLPALQGGLA